MVSVTFPVGFITEFVDSDGGVVPYVAVCTEHFQVVMMGVIFQIPTPSPQISRNFSVQAVCQTLPSVRIPRKHARWKYGG